MTPKQLDSVTAQFMGQHALLMALAYSVPDRDRLIRLFEMQCEIALSAANPIPFPESAIEAIAVEMARIRTQLLL